MEAFLHRLLAIRMPVTLRYALATLLVAVVTAARVLLGGTLQGYPYLLYFPVVIVCALVLECGTGLYATVLSALVVAFLFVGQPYDLALESTEDTVGFLLFLTSGLAVTGLGEALRLGAGQLQAAHDETRRALAERDLLLRELAHRVRNDFQAVGMLLHVEGARSATPETKEVLKVLADRIAVLGRVHTRLAHREHGERINLGAFLRELAADFETIRIGTRLVTLVVDVADVQSGQKQAVYLGLVVNELLTNALKHAFPDGQVGRITITLRGEGDHLILRVADDGVGWAPDSSADRGDTADHGTGLVRAFVQALGGTLDVEGDRGVVCTVRAPMGDSQLAG